MSMVTGLNGTFACLGFDGFFGYLPISALMGGSTWIWSGFTTFLWTLLAICISWGPEPILTCTVHVILDLIMKHWNPDVRQPPKFLAPRQSIHHFGGPETELCHGGLYISRRVAGYYPSVAHQKRNTFVPKHTYLQIRERVKTYHFGDYSHLQSPAISEWTRPP